MKAAVTLLLLMLVGGDAAAAPTGLPAVSVITTDGGNQQYSLTLQALLAMTALTLLPSVLIMLTPFTRIIIVLAILRQGIGTAQTPNNQILIGLALFMTFFVMAPVLSQIYNEAYTPYQSEDIGFVEALQRAQAPLRDFMMRQTRQGDLELFAAMRGDEVYADTADVPFSVLVPAFVTSELKTAFQIGFLLLLPFLIIDLVVASVLMSMGMVMLSPMIISLPFKLMLFVLVDGWSLILGTVASSFAL